MEIQHLKLCLKTPKKELICDQYDGIDRLSRIVNGWSDAEWMQICGRIAINVPVEDVARLFWALGKREAEQLKEILKDCVPMFEVKFNKTDKVSPRNANIL